MKQRVSLSIIAILALSVGVAAQDKLPYSLPDASGRQHTGREWQKAKAAVFFFVATECPISNRYAPEINRIVAAYAPRNFAFYAVHSDPDLQAAVAKKHAQEYGYKFPVLLDTEQRLAGKFGVALTPTVVLISPAGEMLYRGRIDNRYLDFGKYRDAGINPDLRLALDAVTAGKPIAERFTKAIGCGLPPPAKKGQ
ncbi:MAG: redoxin domain-containing protein [Blastocatellia bacterium]